MLQQLLQEGIEQKAFPCAAVACLNPGEAVNIIFAGCHTYDSSRQLDASDLFDLASLSKVIVTTTLTAQLIHAKKLRLEDKVVDLMPEFLPDSTVSDANWRRQVTLRHLLAHCSGLPSGFPFYRMARCKRIDFRNILCSISLVSAPGSEEIYSDLGFLLLGEILQKCGGFALDTLAQRNIFSPFSMSSACYNPLPCLRCQCVPTEIRSDIGVSWQGVVHDETARWLGGVAAHAGVFARLLDLCRFVEAMLNGKEIFGSAVFNEFLAPAGLVPGSNRCLGWNSINKTLVGHTGFTGTAICCNLTTKQAIILLSNAVHPNRACKQKAFLPHRNKIISQWEKTTA